MDLEVAAPEALAHLKDLDAEMDHAQAVLADVDGQLRRAADQLDEEWREVAEDGERLVREAGDARSRLEEDGHKTAQALDQARERVRSAHAEAVQRLSASTSRLASLQQAIAAMEPEASGLFAQAQAAAARVEQLAAQAQGQLESALAVPARLLAESIPTSFQNLQEELQQWSDNLTHYVGSVWNAVFEKMAEAWEQSLRKAASGTVEAGAAAAAANAEAVVRTVGEQCEQRHTERIDEVCALGRRLGEALETLGGDVERRSAEVARAGGAALDDAEQTGRSLEELRAALARARARLARFTFVTM